MSFRRFPRHILIILLATALTLTACNVGAEPSPTLDVNAINTAIVGTTIAQFSEQFTQTALAAPTNTPLPTDTPIPLPTFDLPTTDPNALPTFSLLSPTPGSGLPGFTQIAPTSGVAATSSLGDACNNFVFEGDIGVQDGDILPPGYDFQKVWKIRNTGTCTWDEGYSLVYQFGSDPDLDPPNFDFKKSSDFVSAGEAVNLGVNLTTPCTPGLYEGHWKMRNDQGFYFGTILSVYVEVTKKC